MTPNDRLAELYELVEALCAQSGWLPTQIARRWASTYGSRSFNVLDGANSLSGPSRRSSQPQLAISISDNGPGVAEGFLAYIFEPLTTTKPNGRGIGLNLSRRLSESVGGDIRVDRQDGETVFTIIMPFELSK